MFGYWLDNSKLNKIGDIRITPLKSFAILFFIFSLILPKIVVKIYDLDLYLSEFSTQKEMTQAGKIIPTEKENSFFDAKKKTTDGLKFKKITLADIWPDETLNQKKELKNILSIKNETQNAQAERLIIPVIKVSATIIQLGIGKNGEMETPKDFREAGWFHLGPRPGEQGTALIAGHLDSAYGAPGVFWHLNKLKTGDDIYIIDHNKKTLHFQVKDNKIYSSSAPLEEIYGRGGKARINLITCNGVWDRETQDYSNRLVVSAELVAE